MLPDAHFFCGRRRFRLPFGLSAGRSLYTSNPLCLALPVDQQGFDPRPAVYLRCQEQRYTAIPTERGRLARCSQSAQHPKEQSPTGSAPQHHQHRHRPPGARRRINAYEVPEFSITKGELMLSSSGSYMSATDPHKQCSCQAQQTAKCPSPCRC